TPCNVGRVSGAPFANPSLSDRARTSGTRTTEARVATGTARVVPEEKQPMHKHPMQREPVHFGQARDATAGAERARTPCNVGHVSGAPFGSPSLSDRARTSGTRTTEARVATGTARVVPGEKQPMHKHPMQREPVHFGQARAATPGAERARTPCNVGRVSGAPLGSASLSDRARTSGTRTTEARVATSSAHVVPGE